MKNIVILLILLNSANIICAQDYFDFFISGNIMEFESQRFIMTEIYNISETSYSKLKLKRTMSEIDAAEGFRMSIVSYEFDSKTGVVFTSFNSLDHEYSTSKFRNIHLSPSDLNNLTKKLYEMAEGIDLREDNHVLSKYNERITLDVYNKGKAIFFAFWIDNKSRHKFYSTDFKQSMTEHFKFLNIINSLK